LIHFFKMMELEVQSLRNNKGKKLKDDEQLYIALQKEMWQLSRQAESFITQRGLIKKRFTLHTSIFREALHRLEQQLALFLADNPLDKDLKITDKTLDNVEKIRELIDSM
jgi:hypothetical protein